MTIENPINDASAEPIDLGAKEAEIGVALAEQAKPEGASAAAPGAGEPSAPAVSGSRFTPNAPPRPSNSLSEVGVIVDMALGAPVLTLIEGGLQAFQSLVSVRLPKDQPKQQKGFGPFGAGDNKSARITEGGVGTLKAKKELKQKFGSPLEDKAALAGFAVNNNEARGLAASMRPPLLPEQSRHLKDALVTTRRMKAEGPQVLEDSSLQSKRAVNALAMGDDATLSRVANNAPEAKALPQPKPPTNI